MKIYSNQPPESPGQNRGAQNVQKPAAAEPREQAAQVKKPAPADRVDMSGWNKEVADIMSAVNQLPEVREARVRDIKQRIDAGIYTVDPLRIAERILKDI
jgi:flagellar biosynthesis anti-sigma factor FlgM